MLLRDMEIDYDVVFRGEAIINYIIDNINNDWDKDLKGLLISALNEEYKKKIIISKSYNPR